MRALACPASLKGVLSAPEAAAALVAGFARAGVQAEALPIADGGEGTAQVLGAREVSRARVHDAFGREHEARRHEPPVQDHRARPTVAGRAAFLRSGQADGVAQRVEQAFAPLAQELDRLAINRRLDV